MRFRCRQSLRRTLNLMLSPKECLEKLSGRELEEAISVMLAHESSRRRYQIFFNNEYYPALIPVRDKLLLLDRAVNGLIERRALEELDRQIVDITRRLAREWFVNPD